MTAYQEQEQSRAAGLAGVTVPPEQHQTGLEHVS